MARDKTLLELRTAIRGLGDLENDGNVTDTWLNTAINSSLAEMYDLLVNSGLFYFRSTATPSYSSSTGLAALPADFLSCVAVWYEKDANTRVPLRAVSVRDAWKYKKTSTNRAYGYEIVGSNIQFYPPPPAGQTYTLVYIPACTTLSADGDTIDGVSGWEELIVVDVCIKALGIRQESDVSVLMARKNELLGRITQMAQNREIASANSLYSDDGDPDDGFGGGWYW